jgi:hypothetical protein
VTLLARRPGAHFLQTHNLTHKNEKGGSAAASYVFVSVMLFWLCGVDWVPAFSGYKPCCIATTRAFIGSTQNSFLAGNLSRGLEAVEAFVAHRVLPQFSST